LIRRVFDQIFLSGPIYTALDDRRTEQEMTWRQVADELHGFTASTLTNLAEAPLICFPRETILAQYLCCPAASFVRDCGR